MAGTISQDLRNMFSRIDTLGNGPAPVHVVQYPHRTSGQGGGAASRITNSVFMQPDHQVHRLKPANVSGSVAGGLKDGASKTGTSTAVVPTAGGKIATGAKHTSNAPKPKPWLLIAIVVVLVLMVVAIAGIFFFRRSNKRKQDAEAKRMQIEAQKAQEEETTRQEAEATREREEKEALGIKMRQAAAKEEMARQAAQALRRQQSVAESASKSIPVSVYIPNNPQQSTASSSRVQIIEEQTQKPAMMRTAPTILTQSEGATPKAMDSSPVVRRQNEETRAKELDANVQNGMETLREGVKQSILSQRLHNTEPQRDASVLLSRPSISPDTYVASANKGRDANATLDAFTKPIQQPASAVIVGSTTGSSVVANDPSFDSSALPVL